MLDKFHTLISLYRHFGLRWLLFRFFYALRLRTGIIRWQMPAYEWKDKPLSHWLKAGIPSEPQTYAEWRAKNSPAFFFQQIESFPKDISWDPELAVEEAEKILAGEFKYFEHTYQKIGFPPDWFLDPVSGARLPSDKHWSQIPDDGETDIKFVWEASRFSQVYALVRAYAQNPDERFAEAFWLLVEDWAEKNRPGRGPNWKDGQEISLRIMACCFGFYGFKNSAASTPRRAALFAKIIAAFAERIFQNVDYAISTRSNHTISEAFGLWLAGCLFPEIKNSEKYSSLGQKLLEREAAAQFFSDGAYSMYSLNYQRFVLQIYFYALRLGELNQARFSDAAYRAVSASIDFLYQLVEPSTGQMPVFGSNDGALVSPLTDCDFSDYRPLLQAGYYLIHKKRLFENGAWDEALLWLFGAQALQSDVEKIHQTSRRIEKGGVYILRSNQSKAVIRCVNFQARPSHADQLHVDLWRRGKNIACDAGTYLYNAPGIWRNGLARASVHNTVTVDNQDQMTSLSRFTWVDWAQGRALQTAPSFTIGWRGTHDGYLRLTDPVRHIRSVLMFDDDRWLILDRLTAAQIHHYRLHWLLDDFPYAQNPEQISILLRTDSGNLRVRAGLLTGDPASSIVRADQNSTRGWRSLYYGQKQPAISLALETDQPQACFWTFFGLENDLVELKEHNLNITTSGWRAAVNLSAIDLSSGLSQTPFEKISA